MLSSDAVSSVRTGVTFADRSTYSVQSVAGLVIGAILVVVTHCRDASYSRVTLGASGTDALRSVRDRDALCTTTAHDVAEQAGRDTVVVLAGLVVGTVVIRLALGSETLQLRIASEVLPTVTRRMVIDCSAVCI